MTKLLFPPLKTVSGEAGTYQVDYSVDSNLESALTDLREGINDSTVHNTIARAIDALIEVRKVLHAYPILDPDAKYLIIDTPDNKDKEIEARD